MEELRDNFVVSQLVLRFVLGRDSNDGRGIARKFEVLRVGVRGLSGWLDSMMKEAILGITGIDFHCCS